MQTYDLMITQPRRMLRNLDAWLGKAIAHAEARTFDPEVLLQGRLVPDMYSLTRQIQSACDQAKLPAARLAGKAPPVHPDTETTLAELRARIASVVEYLGTFAPADFDGADDKVVELPFRGGMLMRGADYVTELAQPNFYFHVTMAYALLRHNGVELGKRDYIGTPNLKPKA
jgi:uncharacterized protein